MNQEKTPSPAALPPIPYPNIGKGADKPDSKVKRNKKRGKTLAV